MVGILLTIKKPINPKLIKLKYSFCKKIKLYSKNKNNGNKHKPAAAGEGTPVKYMVGSIGFEVMYISAVNLASLKAAQET